MFLVKGEKCSLAPSPFSSSHLGTLLSLLIRGNNYQSGQVIKLKHKWLHELGWLYYKVFPGLIKEKYGSAHPQCHRAGKNEKKAPASDLNKSVWSYRCRFFGLMGEKKAISACVCRWGENKIPLHPSFLSASVPQTVLFVCVWEQKHMCGGESEVTECRMCGRHIKKKKKLASFSSHLGIMS